MKIKRFENLWTMGLIISIIILAVLYFAKLIFPAYIIGVAQIPRIVEFGNYVDSHRWALYLFTFATSFFALYFYTCACCRIKRLSILEVGFLSASIIGYYFVEYFVPSQVLAYNFILYLSIPLFVAYVRKIDTGKIFYSTAICFIFTTVAQSLSLEIRDISTAIEYPNTATYFILLIDGYIWNVLLYNYYNYRRNENG